MTKTLLAIGAATVMLTASPAPARHYSNVIACSGWRHGQCVAWNRLTRGQAKRIQVGYVFGPNYSYYADVNSLPQQVVTEYHLSPDYRYVDSNGYIFVVDPTTYAVTRVITTTG